MIRVKSVKGDGNTGGTGATTPEFTRDAGNGKGPLAFGIALGAMLGYLRSFLPVAEAAEAPPESGGMPSGPAIRPKTAAQARASEAPEAAAPEEAGPAPVASWEVSLGAEAAVLEFTAARPFPVAANVPAIPNPLRPQIPRMPEEPLIRFPGWSDLVEGDDGQTYLDVQTGPGPAEMADRRSDDDAPPGSEEPQPRGERPNRAPRSSGPVYLADVASGSALVITLSMLLDRTEDPDGDDLAVEDLTVSSGTLTPGPEGWTYTPEPDFAGPVEFRYSVSDGVARVEQTAHARVVDPVTEDTEGTPLVLGTAEADDMEGGPLGDNIAAGGGDDAVRGHDGADIIFGGAGADVIDGGAGDDIIYGGNGNDVISGGAGNDRLFGEADDDVLTGGEGNDDLDGGDGSDVLFGGAGADRLAGGEGEDLLHGDAGDDHLDGGGGSDALFGGAGADRLCGEAGDDVLTGDEGNDHLDGGIGNDTLYDGGGSDTVAGGEGDDRIVAAADGLADRFDGDSGHDTLDYCGDTLGVVFDIAAGVAIGEGIGEDCFERIEAFSGGAGDDVFLAAGDHGRFTGGGGENRFVFGEQSLTFDHGALRFQITDFAVGDRISIGSIDLYRRRDDNPPDLEEVMEDLYDSLKDSFREYDFGDARPRLRLREEKSEEMERTLIEIDFDRDQTYETTISLEGTQLIATFEVS